MIIRKGNKGDAKYCVTIMDKESHLNESDFSSSSEDNDVLFLVAEENKKVLGYILGFIVPTKRTEALIHETRVDKKERNKGIGKKLVGTFCKEIFKKGVKIIYAEIEPQLLKFYKDACEFKESGKWIEVSKTKDQ